MLLLPETRVYSAGCFSMSWTLLLDLKSFYSESLPIHPSLVASLFVSMSTESNFAQKINILIVCCLFILIMTLDGGLCIPFGRKNLSFVIVCYLFYFGFL